MKSINFLHQNEVQSGILSDDNKFIVQVSNTEGEALGKKIETKNVVIIFIAESLNFPQ